MIRRCLPVLLIVLSVCAAACDSDSPTAPTPAPTPAPAPAPTPTPAPTSAPLTGTVSSSAGARLSGATVSVLDGPDAGLNVTTNANGEFRFNLLTLGNANFAARASGYIEDRRGTHVDGTNTLSFTLTPVPPPPPPAVVPTLTISAVEVSRGSDYVEWGFAANPNVAFGPYTWDFGDGGSVDAGHEREGHQYTDEGDFTVRVTATPRDGGPRVTATRVVMVRF